MAGKKVQLSFEEEILAPLRKQAKDLNVTLTVVVRWAIIEYSKTGALPDRLLKPPEGPPIADSEGAQ